MKLTKLASAALAMTMAFSFAPVFAADGSSTVDDTNKPTEPATPTEPGDDTQDPADDAQDPATGDEGKEPTTGDETKPYDKVTGTVNGKPADITALTTEVEATVENPEFYTKYFEEKNIVVPEGSQIVCLGGFEVNLDGVKPGDKVQVELNVAQLDLDPTKPVYVMHELKPGEWEFVEGTLKDGKLNVELTGLSPVAIYQILDVAPATSDKADADKVEASTNTKPETVKTEAVVRIVKTVRTSPNTGI